MVADILRNVGHVISQKADILKGTLILITFLIELLQSILSVTRDFFFLKKSVLEVMPKDQD